jgi:hypothetical protein
MIKNILLLLAACLLPVAPAQATSAEYPPCETETLMQLPRPQFYATMFMHAVERDTLIVMGCRVDSALLRPVRIEYVYALDGSPPLVQVYAVLKLPMELEAFPGCQVGGVTAVMTLDGDVIEIQAHIETF